MSTLMSRQTSTMTISLPEDLKQFVKKRSLTAHYGTPSDYKQHLDNVRRKDPLKGAETTEIFVRLGNYSASHFEGSALDIIFAIATGAIEVFIEHLGGGCLQRGHHKAGVIVRTHDFGLEHDSPGLCPGLGGIDELVIETATRRRRLAMGVGQRDPLVMEPPRLLEGGCGLTEQDSIAREAKDKIRP